MQKDQIKNDMNFPFDNANRSLLLAKKKKTEYFFKF
jgi:hypothetical protein